MKPVHGTAGCRWVMWWYACHISRQIIMVKQNVRIGASGNGVTWLNFKNLPKEEQ